MEYHFQEVVLIFTSLEWLSLFWFLLPIIDAVGARYTADTILLLIQLAKSTNSFKGRLDKFWGSQEILYNWESEFYTGTGENKSFINSHAHKYHTHTQKQQSLCIKIST